jgi:hypothetical protein
VSTPTRTFTATYSPTVAPATATATWTAGVPTATAPPRGRHGVRGRVRYYTSQQAVPDTRVRLQGEMVDATHTGEDGGYAFADVPEGTWEVAADKASDFQGGISPLDAAYVLQAVAQLRAFSPNQRLACDTTGDGQLSALDAARILQFSVGMIERMPVAAMCNSDWLFVPVPPETLAHAVVNPSIGGGVCDAGKIMLDGLVAEAPDQDFEAVLIGDCTGNWTPPTAGLSRPGTRGPRVRLGRPVVRGTRVRLPVYVHSPAPYHALDLQIAYDPERLQPTSAAPRRRHAGALASLHVGAPGLARIALASAEPIRRRSGALLVVEFALTGDARPPTPIALGASVDEQPAALPRSR